MALVLEELWDLLRTLRLLVPMHFFGSHPAAPSLTFTRLNRSRVPFLQLHKLKLYVHQCRRAQ